MPKYQIYLKNLTDATHDDPGPGKVKEIQLDTVSADSAESLLLLEIRRTCADPHQHYSWTIREIGL